MMISTIQTLINNDQSAIHIEADAKLACLIYDAIETDKKMLISKDDGLYSFYTVKQYLQFIADINMVKSDIEAVIETFELEQFRDIKIKNLDDAIKQRIRISTLMLIQAECVVIEEPLNHLDRKGAQLVIGFLESFADTHKLITSSQSFRNVCLMSGNLYHHKEDALVPIYESLDVPNTNNVSTNHKATLLIKSQSVEYLIDIEDIYYIESIDSKANIYVRNSLVPCHYTMDELEAILEEHGFFRSHRSYIVNMLKVSTVEQWTRNSYVITLQGQKELEVPLSKRRYQDFKALLHSAQ